MDYIDTLKEKLYDFGYNATEIDNITSVALLSLEDYEVIPRTALVVYDPANEDFVKKFFVAKVASGLSTRTLNYYKTQLQTIIPKFNKNIKDITADDVRVYLAKRKMDNISGRTIDNERRVLSSFFTYLKDEDLIKSNPLKKIPKLKYKKQIKKAFTEEELEKLRSGTKSIREKAIIEFLYSTGCRISEMCALNREDIDFVENEAVVIGKGNKERKVFISVRCKLLLQQYLDCRTDFEDALFVAKNRTHSRLQKDSICTLLRNIGKSCGVSNVHPHRFRRTCATYALNRGMPIEQVQKMLGHEQIATTLIYTEQNAEQVKASHSKFII